MRSVRSLGLALIVLVVAWSPASAQAVTKEQLLGTWTTPVGNRTLVFGADDSYLVNGVRFGYVLQGNVLMATGEDGNVYLFSVKVHGDTLTVEDGTTVVEWTRKADGGLGGGLGGGGPAAGSSGALPASVTVGFSMTPSGGFALNPDRSQGMIFTSESIKGLLTVSPQNDLTPARLAQANREGWQEGSVTLRAVSPGAHQKIEVGMGSGFYFSVEGAVGDMTVQGFLGGVFGPGNVPRLMLFAFAQPQNWPRFKPHARRMLDSVRLRPPTSEGTPEVAGGAVQGATSPAAPGRLHDSAKSKEWVDYFRGKRARHRSSHSSVGYGGGPSGFRSSSFYWDLCSDGSYFSSDSSNVSVGGGWGGSSARTGSSGRGAGTWRVVGLGGDAAKIVFRAHSGGVQEYQLSSRWNSTYNFDQTYFDGTPMFVVDENEVCR